MNRLIFDHFRRWAWVLALGGALQLGLGMMIAWRPEDPFEWWIFLIAMWMGGLLLHYDLKNGILRAVVSLPLTARQIGRSWWLATILIPAMALGAMLFLGAGTFHWFNAGTNFQAKRLALASLLILPWLGTAFTSLYGINDETLSGTRWQRARASFWGLLSTVTLFGGMLTVNNSTKQPVKFAVFMGVGAMLIGVGWIRAERLVLGRAGFRLSGLGRGAMPESRNWTGQPHVAGGYGGIPFLIRTNCIRTFLNLAAMAALMALLASWRMRREQGVMVLTSLGSFMSVIFIFFLQPMPVLGQLRFLRTLPVSKGRLAAVVIGITILPLIALGVVAAAAAGLAVGTPVALTFLRSYTFILAPASLCAFVTVWSGGRKQVYTLVILFGFLLASLWLPGFLHQQEISYGQTSALAAFCVLLTFLLTRRILGHGGKIYRPQACPG